MFSYTLKLALLSASLVSAFVMPLPRQTPPTGPPPGLSQQCYDAGAKLIASPIAKCFDVENFLFGLLTPMNQSWVGPIDKWLTGTCSQAPCNTTELVAAYDTFTTGCHAEILALGVTDADIQSVKPLIPKYYPLERELDCFKDPSKPTAFCVTTLLTTTEQLIGVPLSPESAGTHLPTLFATGIPKQLLCTECTKGYYGILKKAGLIPPEYASSFTTLWKTQCGSDLGI